MLIVQQLEFFNAGQFESGFSTVFQSLIVLPNTFIVYAKKPLSPLKPKMVPANPISNLVNGINLPVKVSTVMSGSINAGG